MALTQKQQLFIDHYLAGESAVRAAELAGYTGEYASLRVSGSRLLTSANIKQAIAERLRDSAMPAQEVLARLSQIARGSMDDFVKFDANGNPTVDLQQAKERGALPLVKRISVTKAGKVSLELYSAFDALTQLARHYSLFHDELIVTSYHEEISILIASGLITTEDLRNEYPEIATEILDAIR